MACLATRVVPAHDAAQVKRAVPTGLKVGGEGRTRGDIARNRFEARYSYVELVCDYERPRLTGDGGRAKGLVAQAKQTLFAVPWERTGGEGSLDEHRFAGAASRWQQLSKKLSGRTTA